MDFNLFCEEENCLSEASAFYFKATKQHINQWRVCTVHQATVGEKLYPIEQFYFVQSPEDETEFVRRLEEVNQGKAALQKMLSLADDEQTAALELLDERKIRAVQIVSEVYEAEKRRTKQHFHQIEVFIREFTQELEHYLYQKERRLSNPLDKLATEVSGMSLLRTRAVDNDLELARVVMESCSRGELSFDFHLKALLNPKTKTLIATQLFQLAEKSSQADSYIELQQALANCSESEVLRPLPEVTQLKTFLEVRLGNMKDKRESELIALVTRDPESIRYMLELYLNNISIQRAAGEIHQVERLYEKALSFALPESQSRVTLDTLLSFAQCRIKQEPPKTRGLKKIWKAALKILRAYYPKSQETMNTYLHLGNLYKREGKYNAALRHCQAAVAIGKAEFAKSKDTAEALTSLGMVCYLTKQNEESESHFEAALDILKISFPESSEIATVFTNLGMLYETMSRFAEAQESYKLSVHILRSYFPSSHQLASTLTQVGHFYKSNGNSSEAEYCLMEAYQISSVGDFQDLKQQLLVEGYIPVGDVQKIIAVLTDQVLYFNTTTSQWQEFCALHRNIKVDNSTSSTFITPTTIFVCGGGDESCTCHVDNRAYLLQTDNGSVQELPHMSAGRLAPGVAWDSERKALYVFGGGDRHLGTCYTDALHTSEMFLSNEWSPLPEMHQGRGAFNPCWHSCLVYLCGGYINSVETYDPRSNTFALQDFTLPEESNTTAVVECGELTVVSYGYISKLQQGRLTSQEHTNYGPWSSCTPVVSGGAVYVSYDSTCCIIDLTTGALRKEVSRS